jgi:hypothetical protein
MAIVWDAWKFAAGAIHNGLGSTRGGAANLAIEDDIVCGNVDESAHVVGFAGTDHLISVDANKGEHFPFQ